MDTFTRLMQELPVLLPPILSNYWNMSVPTFLTHAFLLSMYLPRYKYMFGHLFSTHRIRNDACWFRFSRWKFYFFIFAYSSRKDNLFLITYITPADFCLMTQVWQYVRFPQFFHSLRKKKISKKYFSHKSTNSFFGQNYSRLIVKKTANQRLLEYQLNNFQIFSPKSSWIY